MALGKVFVFIALMLIFGRRVFPWMLRQVERTGSRELFTLAVIALEWAALGYSQWRFSNLVQIVEVTGVYGVSAVAPGASIMGNLLSQNISQPAAR